MARLRIAIQTNLLPGDTLREKFDRAAALGYDGVELSAGADTDLDALEREAAAASAASGVPVAAVCSAGGLDPLQRSEEERSGRFAKLTAIMAMVESLGATGFVSVPHRPTRGFSSRQERQDWVGQMMYWAERGYGDWARTLPEGSSAVFLEPLNRYETSFMNRVEQAVTVAGRINHPRVRALADLFHMNIEESDLVAPIRDAGNWLGHVHIADNNRLEPGAGCMAMGLPLAALKSAGYTGFVSLECSLSVDPSDVVAVEGVLANALAHVRSA